MAKESFFEVDSYTGYLSEGSQIYVQRSMRYLGENADFKSFLNVPVKDLEQQLNDSKAAEKKVYDDLQTAAKAWDKHGARTLLLQKAIEYLKTPVVEHTGNEWKQHEDGTWEISNLVYKMTFRIAKFGNEWKLTWELRYTAPGLPKEKYAYSYDRTPKDRIEYEGNKKYKTLEGAKKYIQSKFDKYADLFETLSPPVPKEAKHLFCVNGQVLQGYSIMRPAPKKEKVTLDDLLDCLEDQDLDDIPLEQATPIGAKAPVKPPGERPNEPPKGQKAPLSKAAPAKKKAPAKKRPAQVR